MPTELYTSSIYKKKKHRERERKKWRAFSWVCVAAISLILIDQFKGTGPRGTRTQWKTKASLASNYVRFIYNITAKCEKRKRKSEKYKKQEKEEAGQKQAHKKRTDIKAASAASK